MTDIQRPVIFGEVLFDCFPDGEAVLGGAPFNVAWHLQGFGLSPLFISRVGDDALGRRVRAAMQARAMDTSGLQLDSAHPTGRVNIRLSGKAHSFDILDAQAYDYIAQDALPPLPADALFYHGSLAARSAVSASTLDELRARLPGRRLVDVNLRSPWWRHEQVLDMIAGAWLVKLNDEELFELVPEGADEAACLDALAAVAGRPLLLLTRGADGADLTVPGEAPLRVSPQGTPRVVDTVGAGDALTSVMIAGVLYGWPYRQTLQRAQDFASAIVGQRGATVEDDDFYRGFRDAWELT